jgi:hypothetical protein
MTNLKYTVMSLNKRTHPDNGLDVVCGTPWLHTLKGNPHCEAVEAVKNLTTVFRGPLGGIGIR